MTRVPLPGDDPRLHVRAPRRAHRRARDLLYGRIGGLARDLPDGLARRASRRSSSSTRTSSARVHGLMDRNRIFIDRMRDVGVISTADALNCGFTGPILRSTGVPRDLRKDTPYLAYAELDFEVPVGINGDNYDRYYVRMREMDESVHMIRQLARCCPTARSTSTTGAAPSRQAARVHRDRVADQPLQAGHGRPGGAGRRGLLRARGAERRARLLHRQHRRGMPYKVHVRSPSFVHMGGATDARRRPARRHRAHLRLDQHDRRGVRSVKHLHRRVRRRAQALSRRASSRRWCCRACAASRKTAATSPTSDIDGLAAYLGVPRIQIEEVLSFYTQFRREPVGRWHLQACRNVSCSHARRRAPDRPPRAQARHRAGQTTADGRFTLSTVECLGSCGTAPVMMVNEAYHENMSRRRELDALHRAAMGAAR